MRSVALNTMAFVLIMTPNLASAEQTSEVFVCTFPSATTTLPKSGRKMEDCRPCRVEAPIEKLNKNPDSYTYDGNWLEFLFDDPGDGENILRAKLRISRNDGSASLYIEDYWFSNGGYINNYTNYEKGSCEKKTKKLKF